jgi:large subunit ribosomal protein L29
MKAEEVHKLSDQEIETEMERLHRHLYDLRSQAVTEKLENPALLTSARRDIARLKTERRMRELAQKA